MRNGSGGSFAMGMSLGQRAWDSAQEANRQAELDAERKWRFGQEQEAAGRAQRDRTSLDTIAQGYSPDAPVTPAMTKAPAGGMGPVADVADLGPKLNPSQVQGELGKVALRQGNYAAYNDTTERARMLERRAANEQFGRFLATASEEDLFKSLAGKINNNPNVPAMLGYDPKTHTAVLTKPDGETVRLTGAELRQHALALHQLGQGDIEAGVTQMIQAEQAQQQRINTVADRGTKLAEGQSKIYHDTTLAQAGLRTAGAHETMAGAAVTQANEHIRHDRAMEGKADAAAAKLNRTPMTLIDATTKEPVPGFMVMDPKTGKVTYERADNVPPGLQLPKQRPDVSMHDITELAKNFIGTRNPATNKPYTMQEAVGEARSALSGTGGPGVDVDLDKLKAALTGGKGAPAAPAGTPIPANGMLRQPGMMNNLDQLLNDQATQSYLRQRQQGR